MFMFMSCALFPSLISVSPYLTDEMDSTWILSVLVRPCGQALCWNIYAWLDGVRWKPPAFLQLKYVFIWRRRHQHPPFQICKLRGMKEDSNTTLLSPYQNWRSRRSKHTHQPKKTVTPGQNRLTVKTSGSKPKLGSLDWSNAEVGPQHLLKLNPWYEKKTGHPKKPVWVAPPKLAKTDLQTSKECLKHNLIHCAVPGTFTFWKPPQPLPYLECYPKPWTFPKPLGGISPYTETS